MNNTVKLILLNEKENLEARLSEEQSKVETAQREIERLSQRLKDVREVLGKDADSSYGDLYFAVHYLPLLGAK